MYGQSLGYIGGEAFEWETSPEGHDYWHVTSDRWETIISNELAKNFELDLQTPPDPSNKCWPLYINTTAYPKLKKLATYYDRFGQDAPIDLMLELVKD